jgi:hypothetical protein
MFTSELDIQTEVFPRKPPLHRLDRIFGLGLNTLHNDFIRIGVLNR